MKKSSPLRPASRAEKRAEIASQSSTAAEKVAIRRARVSKDYRLAIFSAIRSTTSSIVSSEESMTV